MAFEKPSQRWALVIGLLAVLAAAGPRIVQPVLAQLRVTLAPDRERDESSGLLQLFRGFQLSLADVCFNRSTVYQHSGVLYQKADEDILGADLKQQQQTSETLETSAAAPVPGAATDKIARTAAAKGKAAGKQGSGEAHPGHEGHQHLTLIPDAEDDFRGLLGDVEREVKPFDITHVKHVQPEEALPWLRLATWINPDHEMAWVATAFWLQGTRARNPRATSQSLELLERARALNPPRPGRPYDKQGLIYELAHLYLIEARNPARALAVLEPVLARGEQDFAQLDAVQRDWLTFNFRDAVEACKKLGRHEKAVELCRRGIALFPDDRPLRVSLRRETELLKKGPAKKPAKPAGKP